MIKLTEKRFADYFRDQPETGTGYTVVTAHLKDGRAAPQIVVVGGVITHVRHHKDIPFTEADIDRLEITHDKWDRRSESPAL